LLLSAVLHGAAAAGAVQQSTNMSGCSAVHLPHAAAEVDRWDGDGQTDRRTLDRYMDPALLTMRAVS